MAKKFIFSFTETIVIKNNKITIEAENLEEARQKFYNGEYDSDDVENGDEDTTVELTEADEE